MTNSAEIGQIKWASMTGVLGKEVKGVWPKYSSTNDVNACDVLRGSHDDSVIVTADDFGLVKLFRYPCLEAGQLQVNLDDKIMVEK